MTCAKIQLTRGNLNNGHFYLTSCLTMFPADSIGGSNAMKKANRLLKLQPVGGEELETDIDGTKNIFRKRAWVAAMFERANAKPGDYVYIRKLEDGSYEIWTDKSENNA